VSAQVDVARAAFKLVVTTQEAGALTGRDRNTIAALCELGVIRASRDRVGGTWRIPRVSLDAWIAAGQPMQAVA